MAKTMRSGYKEVAQNEERYYSEEYWRDQKLARKPALASAIPPRTSAHPSAIAAIRPNYSRRFIDLERAIHLDVARLPTLSQKPGVAERLIPDGRVHPVYSIEPEASRRRTDDLLTEHIFHNIEKIVSIDEIDTLPPDVQARLRPRLSRLKRATHEQSTFSEVDTLPTPSIQQIQAGDAQQRAKLAFTNGVEGTTQQRKISIRHLCDDMRWWLIYPGRIEFLLWLIGIIVLICVTALFVLVATVSMGLFGLSGIHAVLC